MDLPNQSKRVASSSTVDPSAPPPGYTPGGMGERKEGAFKPSESVPIVERTMPREVGEELKPFVERRESPEEIELQEEVVDDGGAPIVQSPAAQRLEVELPLDEANIKQGLTAKLSESIRWLAERCQRLLRLTAGRIFYRYEQ